MRVRIPHSLPHLMAGLKVAITFSVIGAIVGEFAGANQGLGYVIEFASTQLDTLKPDSIGRMAVANNAILRINIRAPMQKAIDKWLCLSISVKYASQKCPCLMT